LQLCADGALSGFAVGHSARLPLLAFGAKLRKQKAEMKQLAGNQPESLLFKVGSHSRRFIERVHLGG
jgi:hypothetical protein